jgi:hypothetical protein
VKQKQLILVKDALRRAHIVAGLSAVTPRSLVAVVHRDDFAGFVDGALLGPELQGKLEKRHSDRTAP